MDGDGLFGFLILLLLAALVIPALLAVGVLMCAGFLIYLIGAVLLELGQICAQIWDERRG